jgi:hypothetical protein
MQKLPKMMVLAILVGCVHPISRCPSGATEVCGGESLYKPKPADDPFWQLSGWHDDKFITKIYSLKDDLYFEARDLSLRNFENCGPGCLTVAIGRSPTMLKAFMSALRPGSAVSLPLSNFRFRTDTSRPLPFPYNKSVVSDNFRALTSDEEEKLFQHFDSFLLPYLAKGVTEINLVDISEVGASAMAAQVYIQKYLINKKITLKISTTIVTVPFFLDLAREMAKVYGVEPRFIMTTEESATYKEFRSESYGAHGWSEFGEYQIGSIPSRSARFPGFANEIAARLFVDESVAEGAQAIFVPPVGTRIDRRSRTLRSIQEPDKVFGLQFQ